MPLIADRFTPLRPLGSHLLLVQDRDATPRVLKRLADPQTADAAQVLRLRLEAWRASQLEGPRFARAYWEPHQTEEPAYYLMSYAEGVPATLVSPADLPTVVRELLEALATLHGRGWVHAALEPQLLRRTDNGLVVVGYGNLTPIGQVALRAGHADYQAPEQAAGLPLDGRADLFSLGALIHFWMTGEPHSAGLLKDSGDPLTKLALTLLAPDRQDRPSDATAVLAQLGEPLRLTPPALVAPRLPRAKVLAPIAAAIENGAGAARRLEGPPGSGRSTLLELAAPLAEQAGWAVGRATARAGALPLAPWQALLARLEPLVRTRAPGLLERLQPRLAPWRRSQDEGLAIPEAAAVRARFWDALAEFLAAIAEPGLLLLLDDWEQADEASRATLRAVQLRLREAPIVWLVAGEQVDLEAPPLALPPLTQEEGVALACGALAGRLAQPDAQGLHLVAEGQPWSLLTLVAYLRGHEGLRWNGEQWNVRAPASWPVTPEALAQLRLAELPPAAWQAGMACALLAEPIRPQPLMLLLPELDTLVAGLDALLRAGVLRQGDGYVFTHPAYASLLREALPPAERPAWHARLLEGDSGLDPYALSHHALNANRGEALALLALNAARLVLARGAYGAARELLEEGLVTLPEGHPARGSYLLGLAELHRLEGDAASAQMLYGEALEALEAPAERQVALVGVAGAAYQAGELDEARDRYRQAVAIAQVLGDSDALTRALVGLAESLAALGELDAAIVSGETALGTASEAAPLPRAAAMGALGVLLALTGRDRQLEGVALLQRASAIHETEGDTAGLVKTLLRLAEAEWARGELHASLESAERALAFEPDGLEAVRGAVLAAQVARELGAWERALDATASARRGAEALSRPDLLAEAMAIEGLVREARGERIAVALTANALSLMPAAVAPAMRARALLWHAEALLGADQLPEAGGLLAQAREPAEAARHPELLGRRALLLGRWAARMGDRERARQEWRSVLGQPNQWLVVQSTAELGRLALDAGATIEAAGWLEQARRGAEALGLTAFAEQVAREEALLQGDTAETPEAIARRLAALFQEAQSLLPSLVAPAEAQPELERRIEELTALNRLWPALFTARGAAEIALAMTRAAFQASGVERVFVLDSALEPLASRTRQGGELPYSPLYIDTPLCEAAIADQTSHWRDATLALPIGTHGVLYATGASPRDEAPLAAIAEAAALALDRT